MITSPVGTILWVSGELPAAEMTPPQPASGTSSPALEEAGLSALGDKGYHGYDESRERVIHHYKGKNKPESQKDANRGPRPAPRPR